MEFIVDIFDPQRGVVREHVEAPDAQAALLRLGIPSSRVLSVQPRRGPRLASPFRAPRFPIRLFCTELSVLLAAGIAMLEALTALSEKESSAPVASALRAVIEQLRSGQTFSNALATRPESFNPLFIAMIESSERTGQIDQALREHASYLAWVDQLRTKLIAACIYPATLIASGFAVVLFLLLFVVPRFAGVLESVGGEIPSGSRLLIDIGQFSGSHPVWTALALGALVAAPFLAWQSSVVRAVVAARVRRLPLIGPKLHLLALAQFYRTASMLIGAGVPAVTALSSSRGVLSPQLREPLERSIAEIREGARMSAALEKHGLTTPVSLRMLRVGEHSGEIGSMLAQAASFYDEELSRLTELVSRLINPVLMLLMGTIIGTIVILMYLPIFQLADQVQ